MLKVATRHTAGSCIRAASLPYRCAPVRGAFAIAMDLGGSAAYHPEMDATAAPPVTGDPRRPTLAAVTSLAIHGGALVIAAIVVGDRVIQPHDVELTPIQVVEAPPPPPPP